MFGGGFGILFDKEQIGDTVNFLDVTVSNITDLYCKPTHAHRYLHRRSFHLSHTFTGYLRDLAINNQGVHARQ